MQALKALSAQRPIFHSEADFQHALAWVLHERHPAAKVRLEYRPAKLSEKAYIDIWVQDGDATYAIELKYKTRGLQATVGGEPFNLLDQSAQDQARYDFCRDIGRIKLMAQTYPGLTGLAVFLTNDPSYWRTSGRDGNVDSAFRLHEDAVLKGTLEWASHASDGTKSGRVKAICLAGEYPMKWLPYSKCGDGRNAEFRMAVVIARASISGTAETIIS
jgi:hypothetical protein